MAEAENTAPVAETTDTSVATPTTNEEPAKAPESVTPFLDKMTDDQRKSIDTFFANNGGIEAFEKWKKDVSNPEKKNAVEATETPKTEPLEQKTVEQPIQEPKPVETPSGYVTAQEFMAQQYFNALASNKEYENIADAIRSGEVIKEMKEFNISALDANGNINDAMVRRFLDMKAKTVPAVPQENVNESVTPTVQYSDVKEVTNESDAMTILQQAGHPKHDEALKFMRESLFKKK